MHNEKEKTEKKNLLIGILITFFIFLVITFGVIFFVFNPKAEKGSKTLTLVVIDDTRVAKEYQWKTDEEYLLPALQELQGFSIGGANSDYGMMVDTINGLRADYNKDNAYWAFYVNDSWCKYGVDLQPVYDGDVFRIEYTPASESE